MSQGMMLNMRDRQISVASASLAAPLAESFVSVLRSMLARQMVLLFMSYIEKKRNRFKKVSLRTKVVLSC